MLRPFSVMATTFTNFFDPEKSSQKQTVLVAGYGWGTHAFVSNIDHKKYAVTIVSERDRRLNQNTMLQSLTPTYTAAKRPVVQDTCLSVNKKEQRLVGTKETYPYDYLVIATGSEANDFGIPGVFKHCRMCKTEKDIEAIRSAVSTATGATVLGAGPTGIELACSLHQHGITNIQIIEGAPQILPGFSDAMRTEILRRLEAKGICLHLNRQIQAVTPAAIETKSGAIPYGANDLVIWTCGIRPVNFVRQLSDNGRALAVDETLRYDSSIFAIGDSVMGRGPPTAQNARQQGEYLAALFNADFKGPAYSYKELGRCVDLGNGLLVELWGTVFFMPSIDVSKYMWMLST